jgi:hypothetical protein
MDISDNRLIEVRLMVRGPRRTPKKPQGDSESHLDSLRMLGTPEI